MVDAERFVTGTDVNAGRLAATLVGGVLISYVAGLWRFVTMISETAVRFVTAPIERGSELAFELLSLPGDIFEASWASAGEWFLTAGSALGPWAFVAAILVTSAVLLLLEWSLRNMGVFG